MQFNAIAAEGEGGEEMARPYLRKTIAWPRRRVERYFCMRIAGK